MAKDGHLLKYVKSGPVLEAVLIGAASLSLLVTVGTAAATGKHSTPKSAPVGCVSPPVGHNSAPVGKHSGPVGKHSGPVGCHSAPVVKPKFKLSADVRGDHTVGSLLAVRASFDNRGQAGRFDVVTTVKDSKGRVVIDWSTNNVRIGKNDKYVQTSMWKTDKLTAGKYTISQSVKVDGKVVDSDKKTATVELETSKSPKR